MPELKETRFFGYEGRGDRSNFPIQSLGEYTALFDPVTGQKAIGEATPHYLIYPGAAARIKALLPEARLIASLRNPVDRAYSIYQMNLRNRGVNVGVPFREAMKTDHNLRETYHDMLARYFALFPAEQMRVILLEDLEADPRATVQALFGFLGVDPGFTPDLSKISNPGGEPRSKLLHGLLSHPRLRALSRALLPPARHRTAEIGAQPQSEKTADAQRGPPGGVSDFFREDILRTQDLIGRDLTHWLRV